MDAQGDPFKTLFVARISYEATERKLKRDFEEYGPIKSIRLVHDRNNGAFPGRSGFESIHLVLSLQPARLTLAGLQETPAAMRSSSTSTRTT